ncbi:phosphotransferase [Gammaproteobacteria bacterium]|nr:phosphotransferase [Gammaproteobacteria bacterium]
MLIDIKPFSYIVRLRFLPNLLSNILLIEESNIFRIKALIKILLFSRVASKKSNLLFVKYSTRMKDLSCMKYASDGTRMHLYDQKNSTIGKLPKHFNEAQYENEILARKIVGDITPAVIESSEEDGLIIEEKIRLRLFKRPYSEALKILNDRFYDSKKISTPDYMSSFNQLKHEEVVSQILKDHDVDELIIRMCHGDFWKGNILENGSSDIMIIDWEYCGLRVHTYDGWFLVFSEWASQKRSSDAALYLRLQEVFSANYQGVFNVEKTKILHMIHLFERYATHYSIGKSIASPEMLFLEEELNAIIQELNHDTAN